MSRKKHRRSSQTTTWVKNSENKNNFLAEFTQIKYWKEGHVCGWLELLDSYRFCLCVLQIFWAPWLSEHMWVRAVFHWLSIMQNMLLPLTVDCHLLKLREGAVAQWKPANKFRCICTQTEQCVCSLEKEPCWSVAVKYAEISAWINIPRKGKCIYTSH